MATCDTETCDIKTNLRLIVGVTELGLAQHTLQQPINPGRVGVLVVGGRIRDRDGRPHVYLAGERPAYEPGASRLYGIPFLGKVRQHVIEFAQNPGQVSVTIKHVMLGLSRGKDDPAAVCLHTDLKLVDPIKLLEHVPDWDQPQSAFALNETVVQRVREAAEAAVKPLREDPLRFSRYLTESKLSAIQADFRDYLAASFRDWGLQAMDSLPPTREYPSALTEVVFQAKLGALAYQMNLQREVESRSIPIELARRIQRLEPTAAFYAMALERPDIAIKMVEARGQQAAKAADIVRTILVTHSPDAKVDAEASREVLLAALRSLQEGPAIFGAPPDHVSAKSDATPFQAAPTGDMMGLGGVWGTLGSELDASSPTVSAGKASPDAANESPDTLRLKSLVEGELRRLRIPGVEVEELGGPKDGRQTIEITVDDSVTFRLSIGLDFAERGPYVERVTVQGKRKRVADEPGLLPPWQAGDHLDAVVTLARSEHFGAGA